MKHNSRYGKIEFMKLINILRSFVITFATTKHFYYYQESFIKVGDFILKSNAKTIQAAVSHHFFGTKVYDYILGWIDLWQNQASEVLILRISSLDTHLQFS